MRVLRMWKNKIRFQLILLIVVAGPLNGTLSRADQLASPVGLWLTEGGKSRVSIYQCGEHLCGKIVWLKEPLNKDGNPKIDINNPDQEFRSRAIIGLTLLGGFPKESNDDVWKDGQIYNPEDGKTYSASLTMLDADRMKIRGYIGLPLFGKSTEWLRAKK